MTQYRHSDLYIQCQLWGKFQFAGSLPIPVFANSISYFTISLAGRVCNLKWLAARYWFYRRRRVENSRINNHYRMAFVLI